MGQKSLPTEITIELEFNLKISKINFFLYFMYFFLYFIRKKKRKKLLDPSCTITKVSFSVSFCNRRVASLFFLKVQTSVIERRCRAAINPAESGNNSCDDTTRRAIETTLPDNSSRPSSCHRRREKPRISSSRSKNCSRDGPLLRSSRK